MKNKETAFMKLLHGAVVFLSFLLIVLYPSAVQARTTQLITTVPNQITVSLQIIGDGIVMLNGKYYSTSAELTLPQNAPIRLTFTARQPDTEVKVLYKGKAVHMDGAYTATIENCVDGDILRVEFIQQQIPQTGDESKSFMLIMLIMLSTIGMLWTIKFEKEETDAKIS